MKVKDPVPDWVMLVQWRSQLFMHTYNSILELVATNLTMTTVEQLIWKYNLLSSILTELQLVKKEDKSTKTIFARIHRTGI